MSKFSKNSSQEKVLGDSPEFSILEAEKYSEDMDHPSLYTLLGFKSMHHFEDKMSEALGKQFWLSLVGCFSLGMQEPTRGKIVAKVVNKIISNQGKSLGPTLASGSKYLHEQKEIQKAIKALIAIHPKEALRELRKVKKEAEDTLNECRSNVLTNEDYSKQTLQYLQDLEKSPNNIKEEVIKKFFSDHIKSFDQPADESLTRMRDAVLILRDDKLRCFYDREVERKHISPTISYAECKKKYDTAKHERRKSHAKLNMEKEVQVQTVTNESSKECGEIISNNPCVALDLKSRKLFEGKVGSIFRKQIWLEVVHCLIAGVEEPTRFCTVVNTVDQIIRRQKKPTIPALILDREEFLQKEKNEIKKVTTILNNLNPEEVFRELKEIRSQAKSILYKNLESGVPNQEAFEQTLQYLEDFERWLKDMKEPLITKFLSDHHSLFSKLSAEPDEVKEAMSIMWNNELRYFWEVEGKLHLDNLPVSASAGNELENVESNVESNQASFSQKIQEDSCTDSQYCSEDEESFHNSQQFEGKGHDLSSKVTLIDKKESQLEERLTKELNDVKEKLAQEQQKASQLGDQVTKLTREVDEAKAQLKSDEMELKQAKQDASMLEDKVAQSGRQNSQLQEKLDNTQQSLDEKIGELSQINEENIKLQSELKLKEYENNYLKTKLQESTSKSKGQERQVEDLQRQLQSKNEELNGRNKELSAISAQSRKYIAYASVYFVLFGAFAVSTSLTMSYLATCISLAVAALVSLVVGCYCSYKASKALDNVEVDQIGNCVDPGASRA